MNHTVFVGGLSWNIDSEALGRAFQGIGAVSDARVIMDRDTGKSKGFGFVTFVGNLSAIKATEEMNGQILDGKRIRVDIAENQLKN